MKQIQQDNVVIKINLDNADQSVSQPVLKKMLGDRWRVISSVPVDDNGTPTLILILAPPMDAVRIDFPVFPYIADILVIVILLSIFAAQLFLGGAGV
tara:strand:- start:1455 stop:1745 length:291 start_codon:yes stop_codon:yes gene_type:complete